MNFLKRCWHKLWIRGLVWTGVTIFTLFALLCAWVNFSGARQWRAAQAMLKAEGETLDFRSITSDPIPDAENFCAIPLLKDIALAVDDDLAKGLPHEKRKRLEGLKLSSNGKGGHLPKITNPILGKRADLGAWNGWLRKDGSLPMQADSGDAARDVLAAMSKHDAVFQELAEGLNRPGAQWTPAWKTRELPALLASIALPHYTILMGLNQTLALRAIAAARAGEAVNAHESALIMARINQACLDEPFLIGILVGAAGTGALDGAVWELCDSHAGTVEDFTKLEAALAGLDFHRAALQAWRGEMASSVSALQYVKRTDDNAAGILALSGNGLPRTSVLSNLAVRAIPSGFLDSSCAVLVDRQLRYLIKPWRDEGWRAALESAQDWETELMRMKTEYWAHPSYLITSLVAPASKAIAYRAAYAQTLTNQAVIACALERSRIEKGSYPDSLDAVKLVTGKPLPLDVMSGKPMNYRKTADGRYALWSVGCDGKDDGGKRVLDEKNPENTKFYDAKYTGDWVWDFPVR